MKQRARKIVCVFARGALSVLAMLACGAVRGAHAAPPPPLLVVEVAPEDHPAAVLIRDRQSNQPLYEARAMNDGLTAGDTRLMSGLFLAAMKDFPQSGVNPRRISVQLPP